MGYWLVLPYSVVRHMTSLRLAPAGVVPQRERRPRPIMDYSFYDTNQQSVPIQPAHAMQFGGTLQCILQRLVYCNPTYGNLDAEITWRRLAVGRSTKTWSNAVSK